MQIGYVYPQSAFGIAASLLSRSSFDFDPGTCSVTISGNAVTNSAVVIILLLLYLVTAFLPAGLLSEFSPEAKKQAPDVLSSDAFVVYLLCYFVF